MDLAEVESFYSCQQWLAKTREGGGGGETKSENEKRCSYNLQSGHPAWWKADNCSIFLTVNIFSRKKRTGRGNQK